MWRNSNERTNRAFQTKVSFSVTFDLEAVRPISTLIVNVLLLEYLRVVGVSSALKVLKNDWNDKVTQPLICYVG